MFLGHYGVALAAKRIAPRASLGTLVLAAEFADLLWPIFLLLGWERMRIAPGNMRMTPLLFEHYPMTHSLLTQVLWGATFGLVYVFVRRSSKNAARTAWMLGGLVLSHWVLDWVVHRLDLPLTPWSSERYGLGLWNSLPATVVLECGLFGIGLLFYLRATRAQSPVGNLALWALIALLFAGWVGSILAPPPPSERALAFGSLSIWLTVPWATWADRHREAVTPYP